jgi:hypothetical protein
MDIPEIEKTIESMQRLKTDAVARQDFEGAAKIRDDILQLQKELQLLQTGPPLSTDIAGAVMPASEDGPPGFKKVLIQMPIRLLDNEVSVVERFDWVPDNSNPIPQSWVYFDWLPGRISLFWAGYDGREGHGYLVLTLSAGVSDATASLEEWLADNHDWQIADEPTLREGYYPGEDDEDHPDLGEPI